MNRAVVTGASGAVGYGLISALLDSGVEVIAIGRSKPLFDEARFVRCELSELKDLELNTTADAFFHLAWSGTYGSVRNDEAAQLENVSYTLDAVRLAKKLGCTSFVGVGSQAEYGRVPYGTKLTPELECKPVSFYGKAKYEACQRAKELSTELGLKFNWCRILSAYGIGDKPYTLIMSTIAKLTRGEVCDFTPCEQIWDYISNEDLGRALVAVSEKGRDGCVYVIGSGDELTLKDYVMKMYSAVGDNSAKCNFGTLEYFENQPIYLCPDISALTSDTGFVPSVTFDEGIRRTAEWYKNNICEE